MKKERAINKEKRDKELLAKDRRLNELWKALCNAYEEIPVNPPIRDGWTRKFVLREDVNKSKHAGRIQEALSACNVVQFSHRKDFKSRNYYKSKGKWTETKLELRDLSEKEFFKLSPNAQNYFRKSLKVPRWGPAHYVYVCDIPTWMLVVKVEKHFIRYRKVYDTNIESQYNRLRKEMDREAAWTRLDKIYGYSGRNKDLWARNFEKDIQKDMLEELDN